MRLNLFGKSKGKLPEPSHVDPTARPEEPASQSDSHNDNFAASADTSDLETVTDPNAGSVTSMPKPRYVIRDKRNEVKLHESVSERKRYEELADLYSIFRTTEFVEAVYVEDTISEKEYTELCSRLIAQFKTVESALLAAGVIDSVEGFTKAYGVDCPRAYDRLIRVGVPATVIHSSRDDRGESIIVAETVWNFSCPCFIIPLVGAGLHYRHGRSQARTSGSGRGAPTDFRAGRMHQQVPASSGV